MPGLGSARGGIDYSDPRRERAWLQAVAQRSRALRRCRLGARRGVIEPRHLGRIAARGHASLIEPHRLVTPALDPFQAVRDHDQRLAGPLERRDPLLALADEGLVAHP